MARLTLEEGSLLRSLEASGTYSAPVGGVHVSGIALAEILGDIGSRSGIWDLRMSGLVVSGAFEVSGAPIERQLTFENCRFDGNVSFAGSRTRTINFRKCLLLGGLNAARAEIQGELHVEYCVVRNGIYLPGVYVRGQIAIARSLVRPIGSHSLVMDQSSALGGLIASRSTFHGSIQGLGAKFGADIVFTGCRVRSGMEDFALCLDRADLNGGWLMEKCVIEAGSVRFIEAIVRSSIEFRSTRLVGSSGRGVSGDRAEIAGLFALSRTVIGGGVVLTGATLGGVEISSTNIHGKVPSLVLDAARIASNVNIGSSSYFDSEFRLVSSRVGDQLNLDGLTIGMNPETNVSLNADRSVVGHAIFLSDLKSGGLCGLTDVTTPSISLAPDGVRLSLGGAKYRSLSDATNNPLSFRDAVRVLKRDPTGFSGSSYSALAQSFADRGDDYSARNVRILGEDARRKSHRVIRRVWDALLRSSVRYGEEPWRAVWFFVPAWLLATYLVAAIWTSSATPPFFSMPETGYGFASTGSDPFNPLLTSLGLVLPSGGAPFSTWAPSEEVTAYLSLVLRAVGWVLVSFVAAGILGYVQRRR